MSKFAAKFAVLLILLQALLPVAHAVTHSLDELDHGTEVCAICVTLQADDAITGAEFQAPVITQIALTKRNVSTTPPDHSPTLRPPIRAPPAL